MNSEQIRDLIVEVLDERKGGDIRALDVSKLTTITDYMIIATGTSGRHVKALLDYVLEAARSRKIRPVGMEGVESLEWVLLDLGDVIIHLMQDEARKFYDLERLWSELPRTTESRM